MTGSKPAIVFMGTPGFAVPSLESLIAEGFPVKAVVTSPDKPSGRGLKVQESAVKTIATANGLSVLQPANLKDDTFADTLRRLEADLFIVVAFRMLPEKIWNIPPMGTVNLHASLLPRYRGAAPINHAIINGETVTGVTTFLIEKEIDTGQILLQEETRISDKDTAGSLHDKLMESGAMLLLKTIGAMAEGSVYPVSQDRYRETGELPRAPKISRDFCRINWNDPAERIFNFIRGLSPYPGAWTILNSGSRTITLKIYEILKIDRSLRIRPGSLEMVEDNLVIGSYDGAVTVGKVQAEGRKAMAGSEFIKGFRPSADSYCT